MTAQPEFRKRITETMLRQPAPISTIWRMVDPVHFGIEAGIIRIQQVHMKVRDEVVLRIAAKAGVPNRSIEAFRVRHTRAFDRVYTWLGTVHWYI